MGLPEPTQPSRAPWARIIPIVVAVLVSAGAYFLVSGTLFDKTPTLPTSVAGASTVSSPDIQRGIDAFRKQMSDQNMKADIAFYGSGSSPEFALLWAKDPNHTDPDTAFSAFAGGFGDTSGSSIDLTQEETKTQSGTSYICAPASGSFSGGVCMWTDEDVYWFVFDARQGSSGLRDARDLAVEATSAVETA